MPARRATAEPLPVLCAEPEPADETAEIAATLRFLAVLFWPEDARRRCEAAATWAAALIAGVVEQSTPEVAEALLRVRAAEAAAAFGIGVDDVLAAPYLRGVLDSLPATFPRVAAELQAEMHARLFVPAGGLAAVAAAPGLETLHTEMKRAIETGPGLAGLTLLTVASLARHHPEVGTASLNRAVAALEGTAPGRSIRSLKTAWDRHRVAAHVWAGLLAAVIDAGARINGDPEAVFSVIETTEGHARTLGYAAWFAEWAQQHVVPGAARPVLDCALIEVEADPIEPPLPPVGAEAVERARRYRAPKDVW
jgi:hypothetical protein